MKLGFFYSGTIIVDKENNKFGVAYTDKMFSRYLSFCDEIEVCMRVKHVDSGEGFSRISIPNLSVTEIPNLSSLRGLIGNYSSAKKNIDSVVKKCDFVIIRVPSDIAELVASSCRKNKKKYMLEMVGCALDAFWYHSFKGKLVALPQFIKTRRTVKKAPSVIYVTEKFLQKRYPTNGEWIACSDVELSEEKGVLDKRIKKIKTERDNIIIGTMGAVNISYKGQERVIRALGLLKKRGITNYSYQIVGNGDQSRLCRVVNETNTKEMVQFMGGIPHEQVFTWLDGIDIYIQPSMTEGLPRSVVEAMSRGAMCIGSNVGGIPELINSSFLFANKRNAYKEIAVLLAKLDKTDMQNEAISNIEKANSFKEEELEKKRQTFYKKIFLLEESRTS